MKGSNVIKGGIIMFLLGIVMGVILGNYGARLFPESMTYWFTFSSIVLEVGGIIMAMIGVILWAAKKRERARYEKVKAVPKKIEEADMKREKEEKTEKIGVYRCTKCGHYYEEAKTICVLCGNEVKEVKGLRK